MLRTTIVALTLFVITAFSSVYATGRTPIIAASPDGSELYTSLFNDIYFIDTATGTVRKRLILQHGRINQFALSAQGQWGYATDDDNLYVISMSSKEVFKTIQLRKNNTHSHSDHFFVGKTQLLFAPPKENKIYLYLRAGLDSNESSLLIFNTTGQKIKSIPFYDNGPSYENYSAGLKHRNLYLGTYCPPHTYASSCVTIINTDTMQITGNIDYHDGFSMLAMHPTHPDILFTAQPSEFTALDITTNQKIASAKLDKNYLVFSMAITPGASKAYLAAQEGILVVEIGLMRQVKTIPVRGSFDTALQLSPDGKKLYAISDTQADISVIDTETDEIVQTISLS